MTKPRVYVAAASGEIERARDVMCDLLAANFIVTHDWTPTVEAAIASGIREAKLDDATCERHSRTDLEAVASADVVVFLAPTETAKGAWVEVGHALALGIPVVIAHDSEERRRQSIFTRLGVMVADDEIVETALSIAVARPKWIKRLEYVRWLISQIVKHHEKRKTAPDADRERSLDEQIVGDLGFAAHALMDALMGRLK
jgi:nucleoside 2-deoxyribosyltransferase